MQGPSAPWVHTDEGDDDMPGHAKSSMFGASLNIPITKGRLNLGTWQVHALCTTCSQPAQPDRGHCADHARMNHQLSELCCTSALLCRQWYVTLSLQRSHLCMHLAALLDVCTHQVQRLCEFSLCKHIAWYCAAQGIYLCEHRDHASGRRVVVTLQGE